jgi:hypothetical protein
MAGLNCGMISLSSKASSYIFVSLNEQLFLDSWSKEANLKGEGSVQLTSLYQLA